MYRKKPCKDKWLKCCTALHVSKVSETEFPVITLLAKETNSMPSTSSTASSWVTTAGSEGVSVTTPEPLAFFLELVLRLCRSVFGPFGEVSAGLFSVRGVEVEVCVGTLGMVTRLFILAGARLFEQEGLGWAPWLWLSSSADNISSVRVRPPAIFFLSTGDAPSPNSPAVGSDRRLLALRKPRERHA